MALVTKRTVPRVLIHIRFKPHVLEMLHQGAEYHKIKYQTYLQWLVEEGIKREAQYYGWATLSSQYKKVGLSEAQRREVRSFMQITKRKRGHGKETTS
jgi:hypothetical protein